MGLEPPISGLGGLEPMRNITPLSQPKKSTPSDLIHELAASHPPASPDSTTSQSPGAGRTALETLESSVLDKKQKALSLLIGHSNPDKVRVEYEKSKK